VSALDSATMFTCQKFNTTMLKSVCIRRQTKGVQYSHDTPIKTIPDGCRDCEQGKNIKDSKEVKVMRQRGICTNCERPDMALFSPDDMCGSCQTARYEAEPGKEKEALAAAREKYRGKPKLRRGRQVKIKEKREKPGPKPRTVVTKTVAIPHDDTIPSGVLGISAAAKTDMALVQLLKEGVSIIIRFETDEDRKLLKTIEAIAKRQRRTPDQQILWMCQCEIDLQGDLMKEATA